MSNKENNKLRVLHVASFRGNIGDHANHQAFYTYFTKHIPAEFTQIEMRKFYRNRNELKFDSEFVKTVNSYDLLVLGGGAFFDLAWDYSQTGTTLDISEDVIDQITVPVLVNAMGYHEFGSVEDANVEKFKKFLTHVKQKDNWFLSLRNDGSADRVMHRYGDVGKDMRRVPDHGFYFVPEKYNQLLLDRTDTQWIGCNVTNDLFTEEFNKGMTTDAFNEQMGQFVNTFLSETEHNIVFFLHAHQDVETIGKVMPFIEDKYKRERIVVSPLLSDKQQLEQVFDMYRACAVMVGMRFHANVCAIAQTIPTIGLAGHEQISALYDELDMPERCIKVDSADWSTKLRSTLQETLSSGDAIRETYRGLVDQLSAQGDAFIVDVKAWLQKMRKQ